MSAGGVIKIYANDGGTNRIQLVASDKKNTLQSSKGMAQYKRINTKTAIESGINLFLIRDGSAILRYST